VLAHARWLLRHPGALVGLARGASLRDLILREDLRRTGRRLTLADARGIATSKLNVAVVERLARAFSATPPRTLLDVGAARGSFSVAASLAFPGVEAHAFEPLPEEFAVLARHVAHAYPFALGDVAGTASIHVSKNPGSSSLAEMLPDHVAAFPGTEIVRETRIEVRRLDDVVATENIDLRPPVLLKIDVQGAEDRVLRGGARMLRSVDAIIVEMSLVELYEGQMTASDLAALVESHGFRADGRFHEIRSRSGEIVQVDGLFRRA